MRIIYKYPLALGLNSVNLPLESEVVHIAEQYGQLQMWVEQDPNRPVLSRQFVIYATGQYIYNNTEHHLATVLVGDFVWHVYEVL